MRGRRRAGEARRAASAGSTGSTSYFQRYNVSLTEGQQFTFQIAADSERHDCMFTLDMTVVQNNGVITTEKIKSPKAVPGYWRLRAAVLRHVHRLQPDLAE